MITRTLRLQLDRQRSSKRVPKLYSCRLQKAGNHVQGRGLELRGVENEVHLHGHAAYLHHHYVVPCLFVLQFLLVVCGYVKALKFGAAWVQGNYPVKFNDLLFFCRENIGTLCFAVVMSVWNGANFYIEVLRMSLLICRSLCGS